MNEKKSKYIAVFIVLLLVISAIGAYLITEQTSKEEKEDTEEIEVLEEGVSLITKTYTFSEPEIEESSGLTIVNVEEADFHSTGDGRPVIPVNLTTFTFPFGTEILDVQYEYNPTEEITISNKLSYGSCSTLTKENEKIYSSSDMYPSSFVTYHTGGGLSENEYKTFLNIRIYPITYTPSEDKIDFTEQVKIKVYYSEPETSILQEKNEYELLIITPSKFSKSFQKLANHKEEQNIKTKLITTGEIYETYSGRDEAEQIKYCIKESIEEYGIKSVLLGGGLDGQSAKWNVPARYSHVLIREGTQEIPEPSFLSDLYFADIYDSKGDFSSWDTNNNDVFAEYENGVIDEMDLYPDVHFGRLPCRNKIEAKNMVNKIIDYETADPSGWFENLILVSGDHWADENQISEGVLIMDKAKEIMSDFNPVELYATEENTLRIRDINKAINNGAGFAYFCGHGSPKAWGIHYPPDATGWAPSLFGLKPTLLSFYKPIYMNFLRNKEKLPVTLVGGCNNGQFDVRFSQRKTTSCWAWKLTSQKNGGSIATIANTGLGTHAMDDSDNNGVNDYLEIYDGWLELKFFELYSDENINMLGELHQESMTQYLNTFLGNYDEMDTKMVQQWQLFGDPSLILH